MLIIGITGGTASGKSTFVKLLKKQSEDFSINFIAQDDYYKDTASLTFEEISKLNFDHPDALDFRLLHQHIVDLKDGISIEKPNYSFITHRRLEKTTLILPKPILVLEGILILSDSKIKALCNKTIFIDAPNVVRLNRRIHRDVSERGRTEDDVRFQFAKNINPMHLQFIEHTKNDVDYVFDGTRSFDEAINTIKGLFTELRY